jgi:hypothetical protein
MAKRKIPLLPLPRIESELRKIYKEAVVIYFKVVRKNLREGIETEERHDKPVRRAGLLDETVTRDLPNKKQGF